MISPLHELAETIIKIKTLPLAEDVLANILTPAEIDEIVQRLHIFQMLKKGVAQREIATRLGVGIATVGRGSKELKYGRPGMKALLSRRSR